MAKRAADDTAASKLRGIMHLIDSAKGRPSVTLLGELRQLALDALDVLSLPDPRAQRIATVLLVLRQCTEVKSRVINGRKIDRVTIIDPQGYSWAMCQVHELGAAA